MTSLNILFLTYHQITPQNGGIERVSDLVAEEFEIIGIRCFSAYFYPSKYPKSEHIIKDICLSENNRKSELSQFLTDNSIDIVVNQQVYDLDNVVNRLREELFENVRYVFFQHDRPLIQYWSTLAYYKFAASHGAFRNRMIFSIKLLVSPVYHILRFMVYRNRFRKIYNHVNKFVLLSDYFIPVFCQQTGISNLAKISIIPNCVTLPIRIPNDVVLKKTKDVLIVSRLTDERKRISLALKIWYLYQKKYSSCEAHNWTLRIVGTGLYYNDYVRKVNEYHIPNVIFEGHVNDTIPYYKNASVFMMVSDSEGWGLTLTEAQQTGTVPIAFDSYESIHEIINNQYNGILVKENDIQSYVDNLHAILSDDNKRNELAVNGLSVVDNLSRERMIKCWTHMIEDLMNFPHDE